jgi:hypothetical protein
MALINDRSEPSQLGIGDVAVKAVDFNCGDRGTCDMDFWDGILVTLIPSMIAVAWLVWRAPRVDADY